MEAHKKVRRLAERLCDPHCCGVYRVDRAEALEDAAAINHYPIERLVVNGGIAAAIEAATGEASGVLLLSGFERLFQERPWEGEALLVGLDAAVHARRRAGARYFVALVDPEGKAGSLTPLGE